MVQNVSIVLLLPNGRCLCNSSIYVPGTLALTSIKICVFFLTWQIKATSILVDTNRSGYLNLAFVSLKYGVNLSVHPWSELLTNLYLFSSPLAIFSLVSVAATKSKTKGEFSLSFLMTYTAWLCSIHSMVIAINYADWINFHIFIEFACFGCKALLIFKLSYIILPWSNWLPQSAKQKVSFRFYSWLFTLHGFAVLWLQLIMQIKYL